MGPRGARGRRAWDGPLRPPQPLLRRFPRARLPHEEARAAAGAVRQRSRALGSRAPRTGVVLCAAPRWSEPRDRRRATPRPHHRRRALRGALPEAAPFPPRASAGGARARRARADPALTRQERGRRLPPHGDRSAAREEDADPARAAGVRLDAQRGRAEAQRRRRAVRSARVAGEDPHRRAVLDELPARDAAFGRSGRRPRVRRAGDAGRAGSG